MCAADHLAYDLIAALEARDLPVPKRVAVTGFDGISTPAGSPELSTVVIPYGEIGLIGGKRLMDLIEKRFRARAAYSGGFGVPRRDDDFAVGEDRFAEKCA